MVSELECVAFEPLEQGGQAPRLVSGSACPGVLSGGAAALRQPWATSQLLGPLQVVAFVWAVEGAVLLRGDVLVRVPWVSVTSAHSRGSGQVRLAVSALRPEAQRPRLLRGAMLLLGRGPRQAPKASQQGWEAAGRHRLGHLDRRPPVVRECMASLGIELPLGAGVWSRRPACPS